MKIKTCDFMIVCTFLVLFGSMCLQYRIDVQRLQARIKQLEQERDSFQQFVPPTKPEILECSPPYERIER